MKIVKGSELTSQHLSKYFSEIDSISDQLNVSVYNAYTTANVLYNHSSVLEDILTSNISSLYNKLNSIAFSYTDSSVLFLESFESLELIDKKFHVDRALNIDVLNRTLTLPIKNTTTNEIVSLIIEPDSNGMYGNSLNSYQNSDPASIFDGDLTSMFEYEKFTSIFDSSTLDLVLTLKLAKYIIINSIYIKMYNESSVQYPTISLIETSTDSITWTSINGFITSAAEQNDYYIRFEAIRARYVRIKFTQSVADYVQTGFGIKSRYNISLREIQVITNEFNENGDYVSIPFDTGLPISNVSFTSEYISSNGIEFSISANNGGTWIPVVPDGTAVGLLDKNTGVLISDNIRSIRVKVGMRRTAGATIMKTALQLLQYSPTGSYQLLGVPSNLTASIGGYISCGEIVDYKVIVPFPYNILDGLYNNSGLKFKTETDGSTGAYFADEELPRFIADTIDILMGDARQYVFDNIENDMYTFKIKYVPYYSGIDDDLSLRIGSQTIPRSIEEGGVTSILWFAMYDYNTMHTNIYLDLINLDLIYKIGTDTMLGNGINSVSMRFNKFEYKPLESLTKNIITLNYDILSVKRENITISEFKNGVFTRQLGNDEFTFQEGTKNVIIINEASFGSDAIYYISYIPAFDISNLFDTSSLLTSLIQTISLVDAPINSKILFTYEYQDQQVLVDSKYYSPICRNYKIELS